ncbi:hypothetical protein LTR36_008551 [Oleoguttula mirabilis]|uniref:Proteophosphoglycan ppg4 n=1 Tax=Oleoguttula mirabilis TaxID=1507867 RepID=A0AAV9JSY9_9PEZI|nr:hypothetical protein LTR36_008551 [Oleoguttula mirabilis]
MTDSAFLGLPVELRLRIYEYALQFQGVLHRPLRASAWRNFDGYLTNTSILSTCRQTYREAIDVLYDLNSFNVSYHHICTCQARFPVAGFREQHIRRLEICNFLPRMEESETCQFCSASGSGLIAYAQRLPKLRSLKVAFEDIFSFTEFAPELLRNLSEQQDVSLTSDAVGTIEVGGLTFSLELRLPALRCAWAFLADGDDSATSQNRQPGQDTMERALEYLQFEANTYARTASSLAPFFIPNHFDETQVLRLHSLADERKRRAEFTIALAGVLHDIFADDGGSGSIDWVDLDGMYGGRWRFDEVAGLEAAAPAQPASS